MRLFRRKRQTPQISLDLPHDLKKLQTYRIPVPDAESAGQSDSYKTDINDLGKTEISLQTYQEALDAATKANNAIEIANRALEKANKIEKTFGDYKDRIENELSNIQAALDQYDKQMNEINGDIGNLLKNTTKLSNNLNYSTANLSHYIKNLYYDIWGDKSKG